MVMVFRVNLIEIPVHESHRRLKPMSNQATRSRAFIVELRQSTFQLMLVVVSVGAATLIWLGNVESRSSPPEIVILWAAVELICAVSWWLYRRNPTLAFYVFSGGLWVCNALAFLALRLDLFGYLFALITLITGALTSRFSNVAISLVSSAFLVIMSGQTTDITPMLVLIWFAVLTGQMTFRNLYKELDIAWNYENYAIRQMAEAREHRARLMQLTKALTEARADLERANNRLRYAHHAAEESRRFKAQFAANVSHELRTPINLIVGFSETIVLSPETYGMPLPSAYWADMNTIYRSARHLQSLINDVLDASQIEAGKMAIVKEEVDTRQVIQEAANIARELIESRGLRFHVYLPDS